MSDEISEFERAKRRRDDAPNQVPCARCGKMIFLRATRCDHCGVHFTREAFQFIPSDADERDAINRRRRIIVWAGLAAIGGTTLALLLYTFVGG